MTAYKTMANKKFAGEKIAVVLLNLGGPSGEKDIRPFLFNFFRDENVIAAPKPVRFMIAFWISATRSRGAAKKSYAPLGGKSPLLENTEKQAAVLEKQIRKTHPASRVFIAMRHWHPRSDETARAVAAFKPDKIVLLPLYPQYSTTTTLSAFQDWRRAAETAGLGDVPSREICCYPANAGFISASAALVLEQLAKTTGRKTRVLFSAHGLPEKIIASGDPYQAQVEQTAAAIVRRIDLPGLDWQICYQSRVGPLKWIGPSLDEALQRAAADKVGVVVYPLAFVSEHVETLVELDIDYKRRAAELGVAPYLRAATVGTHARFIAGLKNMVLKEAPSSGCLEKDVGRDNGETTCKCYRKEKQ